MWGEKINVFHNVIQCINYTDLHAHPGTKSTNLQTRKHLFLRGDENGMGWNKPAVAPREM